MKGDKLGEFEEFTLLAVYAMKTDAYGVPVQRFVEKATGRNVTIGAVYSALDRLEERWPGFRDRLCEPGPELRHHIHVYVDRERATLETVIEARSRVDVIAAISSG